MKVVVTATGPSLDATVDPRFGRCPYFVLVETDDLQSRGMENPCVALGSGAGIQAAKFVTGEGAEVVLTGACGPKAYDTLTAAGVEVLIGCQGTLRDAIEDFRTGRGAPVDR